MYANKISGNNERYGGGEMDVITKVPIDQYCIICDKLQKEGISLYASFVCRNCEKEIIQTDAADPEYKYYLNKLNKIKMLNEGI